ncbi:MAG: hypothetical protein DI533_00525 [Cereibacter sphaeroides]|uniref:Uncharacterized protein n=1 Tax=Cereibacter sphaeroides TaxID=1063 RepID=A0A2W5TTD8_CERSP|nr:MAG: hypothetical protein DI533_00525 [Cereibacter sphaeroides]
MKEVGKDEFDAFLASYPRQLVRDVYGAGEPPMVNYNDFTLGEWPESIVAYHFLYGPPVKENGVWKDSPPHGWKIKDDTP